MRRIFNMNFLEKLGFRIGIVFFFYSTLGLYFYVIKGFSLLVGIGGFNY